MANKSSTQVTNADAQPKVLNSNKVHAGVLQESVAVIAKEAGDTDTHVFRFMRVRSSDRVSAILIAGDALSGATDVDVGLYRTTKDGGAEVDADLFYDGISIASAADFTTRTRDTATFGIEKAEQAIWQLLGLSADPGLEYDLTLLFNTGGSAAGDIAIKYQYVA